MFEPFTDIQGHWAQATIRAGQLLFIAQGYPDSTEFKPDQPATRAEALSFTMRALAVGAVLTLGVGATIMFAMKKGV